MRRIGGNPITGQPHRRERASRLIGSAPFPFSGFRVKSCPSRITILLHSELRPAVFLDRDGVLNRTTVRNGTPFPPMRVDEVEVLPRVADAVKCLSANGLPLIVVTNQPDVARGTQTREVVEQINASLKTRLPELTAFYVCYHDNSDGCDCRKPGAG